uniref:Uncharacterized protein n=1 Tax=Anguilla anguilla TaxID=7936 RepID=A0A0E9W749_ANGAN
MMSFPFRTELYITRTSLQRDVT